MVADAEPVVDSEPGLSAAAPGTDRPRRQDRPRRRPVLPPRRTPSRGVRRTVPDRVHSGTVRGYSGTVGALQPMGHTADADTKM